VERLPFGDTGIEVTRMGVGLAALGRPGYVNLGHAEDLGDDRSVAGLHRRTGQVLDRAYEPGSATSTPHAPTATGRPSSPTGSPRTRNGPTR
jgi:hypothetical protein